jgi:hypothetical protein
LVVFDFVVLAVDVAPVGDVARAGALSVEFAFDVAPAVVVAVVVLLLGRPSLEAQSNQRSHNKSSLLKNDCH